MKFFRAIGILRQRLAVFLCMLISGCVLNEDAAFGVTRDAPVVARKPDTLRTHRFEARITNNGTVAPFKIGTLLKGEFTYDLAATDRNPDSRKFGLFRSPANAFRLNYGTQTFDSTSQVYVSTAYIPKGIKLEGFSISSLSSTLPAGWSALPSKDPKKSYPHSIGIVLENSPTRNVLSSDKLPRKLSLAEFTTKELRLYFPYGVRSPAGVVTGLVRIHATLVRLEFVETER